MINRVILSRTCCVAAAVVGMSTASAMAGIQPPVLSMDIQVFSKADTNTPIFDQVVEPTLVGPFGPPGSQAWSYDVGVFHPSFVIQGDVNASPTTSPFPALLNTTLNFANTSSDSLWFLVRLTMPIAHTFTLPASWESPAEFTLTGPDPELRTLEDTPLWTVGVDGSPLGSLFPDPTVLDNNQLDVNDFMSGVLANPVNDHMYIDIIFKLSPDAVAGVNGAFRIIPAPGALALLGLGGLIAGTRRRREN
jgi:hypothetical protein